MVVSAMGEGVATRMGGSQPGSSVPAGACDSHLHVFGTLARYPGAPTRQYTPSEKPLAEYLPVAGALGVERMVLVQPSGYGSDNRCLLDTLRARPGALRGIVVIDESTPAAELQAMHALGVRGIRLNLMNPRVDSVAQAQALLGRAAERIGPLGWHVQIYADTSVIAPIAPVIGSLGLPVVLDHMAGVRERQGVDHGEFRTLVRLLESGGCWAKLSGADIVTGRDRGFSASAAPFARALVAANPRQLVWGTDWPHLVHFHGAMGDAAPPAGYRPVDEAEALALLRECAGDDATFAAILVANPARLYGF